MSENSEERVNNSFDEILGKNIVDKLLENMGKDLTEKQIRDLKREAEGSIDFIKAIDNVKIPTENYVVFTDGDEQVLYENGEFFIISTTDTPLRRKKISKKEATERYLQFFITYELNRLIARGNEPKKEKEKNEQETPQKKVSVQENTIEKTKEEVSPSKEKEKSVVKQQTIDKDIER